MPAQKEEVRAALAEGIQLHELAAPVQMVGDGHVRALRCQRMTLSDPDEQGRRRPVAVPDQDFEVACDHVLVAIGEAPDPSFLPAGTSVEVGLLINPQTLATGAPGVFAAGDVTYGPKSIIHAAAHGRLAARSMHAFLRRLSPAAVSEMPDGDFMAASLLPQDGALTLDLRPQPREELPLAGSAAAHDRSIEFVGGFSEEQARHEASRCLRCDLSYLCPTIHVVGASGEALAQASR
jgi:NADPH-dependent glutamate synthase beta subunit-like oxidoreductase